MNDLSHISFALQAEEPLYAGLRRLVDEQISVARLHIEQPAPSDDGIHEARKALKRARAILRLLRDGVGDASYRPINILCRDAGRMLSPLRIGAVLQETLLGLLHEQPDLAPILAPLQQRAIQDHALRVEQANNEGLFPKAAGLLIEAQAALHALPAEGEALAVFSGLQRTYRRGRREWLLCQQQPSAHHFHLWRKRVKYLRHQMEVLQFVRPALLQGYVEELVTLSRLLGRQHDLVDLGHIMQTWEGDEWQEIARRLAPFVQQKRGPLEREAVEQGVFVYAERPGAFRRRIAAYWQGWLTVREERASS